MIAIDTTFFGHQEIRKGQLNLTASLFTAEMLQTFTEMGLAKNFVLIVNYNHKAFFEKNYPQYKLSIVKNPIITLAAKLTKKNLTNLLKKIGSYKSAVQSSGAKIIWFPFTTDTTFVDCGVKTLTTFHDIYSVHNNKTTAEYIKIINKSTRSVCVSQYTKDDIVTTLSMGKDFSIIPDPIRFSTEETEIKELAGRKFILDINAYVEKKNTLSLLKAFNIIKDKTDADLVLCGGYKNEVYFKRIKEYLLFNGLDKRVKIYYRVSDKERNWLLSHACLFVTPSLFEGFGRTPVEAAVYKVPVISTKNTALYEATQGLVNYVEDSTDHHQYAALMERLLNFPPKDEELQKISDTLKNLYSPQNCVKKYVEIFKSMK